MSSSILYTGGGLGFFLVGAESVAGSEFAVGEDGFGFADGGHGFGDGFESGFEVVEESVFNVGPCQEGGFGDFLVILWVEVVGEEVSVIALE